MFGRYAYRHLNRRDNKGGDNRASTATSNIYLSSSTTINDNVAGLSTQSISSSINTEATRTETTATMTETSEPIVTETQSSPSVVSKTKTTVEIAKPSTSNVASSSSTLSMPTSTSQAQVQQTETPNLPIPVIEPSTQSSISSQQTQATAPPINTPAPPQLSPSDIYETSSEATEVLTTASTVPSSSAQAAKLMVTSLEDLPQSIMSPTSTVPVSISLLVATSSTTPMIMSTVAPKPSVIAPHIVSTSSVIPSSTPSSTSMNASGKVSLILGVVMFLATGCIIYQLYFRKKRQAARLIQNEDDEKKSFARAGEGEGMINIPKNSPHTSQINAPLPTFHPTQNTAINSSTEDHINPFGNHAEIIVDSVNAKGPKVIEKLDSPVPRLARGASKRGVMSHALAPDDDTIAYQASSTVESTTSKAPESSPTSSDPMALPKTVPAVYRVQIDFNPSMDDELVLRSGQLIRVLHEFDDGWAMCIRLDGSEQGVCPRTCLSARPLKPRSPSSSTISRQCSQATTGQNNIGSQKYTGSTPPSPQELPCHRVNMIHENENVMGPNSPQMRPLPQVPVEVQNPPSNKAEGFANDMINQPLHVSQVNQNMEVLPLKNATRSTVSDQNISENPSVSQEPVAPSVDYFSFNKVDSDEQTVNEMISGHRYSQSVKSMISMLGVSGPHQSHPISNEKSVPGQAL